MSHSLEDRATGNRLSQSVMHPQNGMDRLPDRRQIVAASAGWVAVILNVIPGLGAGYLYQRRWRAYWITTALASAWFLAGALRSGGAPGGVAADMPTRGQSPGEALIGLVGLVLLAAGTAVEAGWAVKRVRADLAGEEAAPGGS
jgi:hypothetical protein